MSRSPGKAKGFGRAIQAARLDRGWSQEQLAEEAGVSRPTVSRVELGDDPSMRTARKLAKALGLTLNLSSPESP
ncbi:helix-turn-helix transcriptional regulator [Arthrobacter sp. Bi83]|uniref:helix-turn-helix transcriptional regulator n=1 Tax=Arthrobacter sp. Bi83 TaxID=2822353 RepID=UPI001E396CA3|nr:helix-turn-helix transcriptional regulator [Arthrobacter sp. Bi83]